MAGASITSEQDRRSRPRGLSCREMLSLVTPRDRIEPGGAPGPDRCARPAGAGDGGHPDPDRRRNGRRPPRHDRQFPAWPVVRRRTAALLHARCPRRPASSRLRICRAISASNRDHLPAYSGSGLLVAGPAALLVRRGPAQPENPHMRGHGRPGQRGQHHACFPAAGRDPLCGHPNDRLPGPDFQDRQPVDVRA